MLRIARTSSDSQDFQSLVRQLDQNLRERDGDEHAFYAQFNKIDSIKHAVVAYTDGIPVGCGAIKAYSAEVAEIKRMFVGEAYRSRGIAQRILLALEQWARELGYTKCILETGKKQTEALRLYHKMAYSVVPNYGQYAGVENSICMEKALPLT